MSKVLGKGSIVRRDRKRDGTLKDRSKCRLWEISLKLDDGTRKTSTFTGTYGEAERERDRLRAEVESAAVGGTFREVAAAFHASRESSTSYHTRVNERSRLRNLCLHLGDMDIASIGEGDIARAFDALRDGESISGTPLSESSMQIIAITLGQVFGYALKRGIVNRNPLDVMQLPHARQKERRYLTDDELDALMSTLSMDVPQERAVVLICACGLRRGEVVALKWRDFDGASIHVRRADDGKAIGPPKTDAGIRAVPVPREIAAWLEQHRMDDDQYIVSHGLGDRYRARELGRWWHNHREGFGTDLDLHELRHSYATRLARNGVHPRIMQALMGHATMETTLQVYTHVSNQMERDAVDAAFGGVFGFRAGLVRDGGQNCRSKAV